jgi:hypothetical protein
MHLWTQAQRGRRDSGALDAEVRDLFRAVYPQLPAGAPLRHRRLRADGWHDFVVVEAPGTPARRLVVKAMRAPDRATPRQIERQGPMLAAEYRLLTEVAPAIAAANPATRCPRALAYRASPGLLALEAVPGRTLARVLFGMSPTAERRDVRRLLELSGEWLGLFHQLTRTAEAGNPFA